MKIGIDVDMGKSIDLSSSLLRMDGLKRGLVTAGIYLKGQLGEYPTQPSGVSYVRTGNLRNRWTNKASNGGLTQTIGNNADYAEEVQSVQRNPYFRKVWGGHSIRAVTNRESARVGQIVANEVKRSI